MKKNFKIEPRIKSLVDILNEVLFIKTNSSCEGHFDSEDQSNHRAYVSFDIESENDNEFEKFALHVLSQTAPFWADYEVGFFKRYYVIPEEDNLRVQYAINIKPFKYGTKELLPTEILRERTDRGIEKSIEAIRDFLGNTHLL